MANMRVSYRLACVMFGSILSAIGLELFLVPHNMLIGGVTGASVLLSYLTEMRLGLFLFLLNLPFLLFRYRRFDPHTRLITLVGLSTLSLTAFYLHPAPPLMEYSFAAATAGGIAFGVGIGMVLRYGGFIDAADGAGASATPGTSDKTRKALWLFNGAVLLAGGFVFGWDEALYSIVAFLLAFRMADFSMSGFALTRMVWITSERSEAISDAMRSRFGKELILLDDREPCPGGTRMMLCTVNRIEQARVIREIRALDPECSIAFHAVHR
ncbi:YitT family protein [Cohnella cholangitidis]|uniref:YitT family protein n=1 Tax=Cohnella cholangitidis TaxID=2598458 RepID=A0A7G5C2H8_9BACL|nr:YitT family protein [Cohnella cholangitidis]QMV43412.1 YitT family protein [Cohnella cholangitidis]